jgi:hypothetical protein
MYIVARDNVIGYISDFGQVKHISLNSNIYLTRKDARQAAIKSRNREMEQICNDIIRFESMIEDMEKEIASRSALAELMYAQGKNSSAGQVNRKIDDLMSEKHARMGWIKWELDKLAEFTTDINPFKVMPVSIPKAKVRA